MKKAGNQVAGQRKPSWLKVKMPIGSSYHDVYKKLKNRNINTICVSGKCPNIGQCWEHQTATYMILGDICTRACGYCNVKTGKGAPPDGEEPAQIAGSVKEFGLKHVVITSVDRDDLDDLGAEHWEMTIRQIKKDNPEVTIEALIPDFQGKENLIEKVLNTRPEVVSHNLETVRRLTPEVRSRAQYHLSLKVIKQISDAGVRAKSGIMVGLGETDEEVYETMDDLLENGCEVMTLGQYLQPSPGNLEVKRFVTPGQFEEYERTGLEKGFKFVESAPLVRSSYHAHKHLQ